MPETIIPPALQAAAELDAAALAAAAKLGSATYTVADLARLLQCSERHVWRQADLNAIPGKIRFGRLVRFARSVVDAWLAEGAPTRRRGER